MLSVFNTVITRVRSKEIQMLTNMGLSFVDAEDVFQDASVAFYDIMNSQRLIMRSTPEAYFHGICQNMAHKRLEELKKVASYVDDDKLDRLLALTVYVVWELIKADNPTIDYVTNSVGLHLPDYDCISTGCNPERIGSEVSNIIWTLQLKEPLSDVFTSKLNKLVKQNKYWNKYDSHYYYDDNKGDVFVDFYETQIDLDTHSGQIQISYTWKDL